MRERFIDIPTRDGQMPTFITHPESDGPFPVVIVYMDVWGVREELYDIARRIGTVGYYCVVPDLFYRHGTVRFDVRNYQNQVVSVHRLDAETQSRMQGILQTLSNTMVVEDTGCIIEFLFANEPVLSGSFGGVGYCMGGRHVICAAAAFPKQFKASASLHGTELVSNRGDSAHLSFQCLNGELYCGFGEHDPHSPSTMIAQLDELLRHCDVDYRFEVHRGAEHGYALSSRDVYSKQAETRDWEVIFGMLHRQIPPHYNQALGTSAFHLDNTGPEGDNESWR